MENQKTYEAVEGVKEGASQTLSEMTLILEHLATLTEAIDDLWQENNGLLDQVKDLEEENIDLKYQITILEEK